MQYILKTLENHKQTTSRVNVLHVFKAHVSYVDNTVYRETNVLSRHNVHRSDCHTELHLFSTAAILLETMTQQYTVVK